MEYTPFFVLSSLLGDELYATDRPTHPQPDVKDVEKRFERLYGQPIDDFLTSGLPRFDMFKKSVSRSR